MHCRYPHHHSQMLVVSLYDCIMDITYQQQKIALLTTELKQKFQKKKKNIAKKVKIYTYICKICKKCGPRIFPVLCNNAAKKYAELRLTPSISSANPIMNKII